MSKIPMLKVVGLFLPVLMMTRFGFADIPDELKKAEEHVNAGQYAQAEQIYQNIINKADPNKPEELESAFNARRKLPFIYLAIEKQPQAQVVVQQLLTNHADHERLPHAVHEIVEQAKGLNKMLEAGWIYQNILTAQPKHPQAIWLKMGIAITNAHLNNDQAVDSTLQNIIAEHVADERAAEALGQTAWAYRKLEKHENARKVYKYVVDNWSNKDRAVFSQRGIILCSLELKDQEAADVATQELLQKFAGDKNLAKVAWTVADVYKKKMDWERTRPLCEYILKNHPGDADAIWAQQALIFASIDQKDAPGVEAGLQALFAKFSSHKKIPSAAYGTARKLNRYNDAAAQKLYQYIIDNHPDHDYVPFARVNLGQIKIRQSDDTAAVAIFNEVMAKYKGHPILPKAIALMAEGYWEQALFERRQDQDAKADDHFKKALAEWEKIATQFPDIPFTSAQAYHFAGNCYRHFKQYEKANEYYQKVIDNWPDYQYAWHLQYMIGLTYKHLKETGAIPESEADPAIKAAYERVVKNYPDCKAAKAASAWLDYYNKKSTEGGQK